jgi:hypothetical protein
MRDTRTDQPHRIALGIMAWLTDSARDLAPNVTVIAFFQALVLGAPVANLRDLLWRASSSRWATWSGSRA